jgi:hypothetical protein
MIHNMKNAKIYFYEKKWNHTINERKNQKAEKIVMFITVSLLKKINSVRSETHIYSNLHRCYRFWDNMILNNNLQSPSRKIVSDNHSFRMNHKSSMFQNNTRLLLFGRNRLQHNYYPYYKTVSSQWNLLFQIHHWLEH